MDIGFIGAGSIAAKHRGNLENIPKVNITAICDIDEKAAKAAAEPYDAETYTDHETMYDDAALDAVFIVIPPFAHTTQEIQAVERGIPLFVEKPVALSVDHAKKVQEHIADAGIINQAGYVLRFSELIDRMEDLITPSEVSFVEGQYFYPGAPDSSWWGERAKSGGQVVEQSTHVFDMVQYLFGEVERVYATGDRRMVEEIDFPDTTLANITHDTGVISHVTSSIAAPDQQLSIRVVGPAVDLTLDFIENRLTGTVDGAEIDYEGETDPFVTEIEAFLRAVETGDQTLIERSSYREAIETLELTLAVNESLDATEPIEVP